MIRSTYDKDLTEITLDTDNGPPMIVRLDDRDETGPETMIALGDGFAVKADRAELRRFCEILMSVLSLFVLGCAGESVDAGALPDMRAVGDVAVCDAPVPLSDATYVRTALSTLNPKELGAAFAECDPGDLALSGGCTWGKEPATVAPAHDAPTLDAAEMPTGWACQGRSILGIGQTTVAAFAVCVTSP